MKYYDSGNRQAEHTLLNWLATIVSDDVVELRVQTGYFRHEAVRSIAAFLERAGRENLRVAVVVGANEGDTTFEEAKDLLQFLGIPRSNAKLGIVSYSNGLFHPKTYHVKRLDGSQAAFVGSANFTVPGVTSGNIEAAVALDTRDGDLDSVLSEIGAATDVWFETPLRDGISVADCIADLERLRDTGILSSARPVRNVGTQPGRGNVSALPALRAPIFLPDWPASASGSVVTAQPAKGGGGKYFRPVFTTFGMTLQNTDVGHGQTTEGKQARSPEIFIPIKALDGNPSFWGWADRITPDYEKYVIDRNWAMAHAGWITSQEATNRRILRPLNKLDWHNVRLRFGDSHEVLTATIWFNPDKKDIRIRNSALRDAGQVMDILLMRKAQLGEEYDYDIDIIRQGNPRYNALLAKLTTLINNSEKRIGYF